MPTTSPWNIPYPDGPTVLTALQSHFANIANATNEALTNGLGGAPRLAASDAERNAIYPAPVQGNGVYRTDKGYEERYYALYNVSTNPGGAVVAGWHPAGWANRFDPATPIFTVASGWTLTNSQYAYNGSLVSVRISVTKASPAIASTATGNLVNTLIGTISVPAFRPMHSVSLSPDNTGVLASYHVDMNGSLYIAATVPNLAVAIGDTLSFSGIWLRDAML